MERNLETYLYNSISDIQSTIRALDTKAGFVFVVLSVPFTNLGKIFKTCESLVSGTSSFMLYLSVLIIAFFLSMWLFAYISTIRAIISIENPASHIVNFSDHYGSFYSGGLFNMNFFDSIFNRKDVTANKDVRKHLETLPSSPQKIIEELAFEQIKLVYIRDIKSIRQKWAYRFTTLWLTCGFAIYILNKLTSQLT